MARAISDEELQLKRRARRRLIGAIVLVTAMVVVLPMVLDTEPGPVSQEITVRIPAADAGAFTTKVAPAPAPKVAETKAASDAGGGDDSCRAGSDQGETQAGGEAGDREAGQSAGQARGEDRQARRQGRRAVSSWSR